MQSLSSSSSDNIIYNTATIMNQAGYKLVDDLFGNAMSDVSAISFTGKGTIFNKNHGMFNVSGIHSFIHSFDTHPTLPIPFIRSIIAFHHHPDSEISRFQYPSIHFQLSPYILIRLNCTIVMGIIIKSSVVARRQIIDYIMIIYSLFGNLMD